MTNFPLIPVILGATATGKTAVGIELAKLMGGEVISVDSRKVYKYLPIGTAAPRGEWVNGQFLVANISHHLIGHLDPDQPYNAGDFSRDAENLIGQILERGKLPLLIGGTGFYFKALAEGLPEIPPHDEKIRKELAGLLKEKGHQKLFADLKLIDPDAAGKISPQDSHKLIRAMEVFKITGRPFSVWKKAARKKTAFKFLVLGLHVNKSTLEKKIEARSRRMVAEGMIEETEAVLKKGFPKDCPALLSFGYREAVEVLEGKLSRPEFLTRLIKSTKSYAKRQLTWFRTQVKPVWFEGGENLEIGRLSLKMRDFLSNPREDLVYSSHA